MYIRQKSVKLDRTTCIRAQQGMVMCSPICSKHQSHRLQRCHVRLQTPRSNSDSLPSIVHKHDTDTLRSICELYKEYVHLVVIPRRSIVSVHKCLESFGRFIQSFRAGVMLVMKCVLAVALFHPKPLQKQRKGKP